MERKVFENTYSDLNVNQFEKSPLEASMVESGFIKENFNENNSFYCPTMTQKERNNEGEKEKNTSKKIFSDKCIQTDNIEISQDNILYKKSKNTKENRRENDEPKNKNLNNQILVGKKRNRKKTNIEKTRAILEQNNKSSSKKIMRTDNMNNKIKRFVLNISLICWCNENLDEKQKFQSFEHKFTISRRIEDELLLFNTKLKDIFSKNKNKNTYKYSLYHNQETIERLNQDPKKNYLLDIKLELYFQEFYQLFNNGDLSSETKNRIQESLQKYEIKMNETFWKDFKKGLKEKNDFINYLESKGEDVQYIKKIKETCCNFEKRLTNKKMKKDNKK